MGTSAHERTQASAAGAPQGEAGETPAPAVAHTRDALAASE